MYTDDYGILMKIKTDRKKSISTAKELYRAAVAMHEMTKLAAPHIKPIDQKQSAVFIGYYFNLCFSIELYLKAYLRDKTNIDIVQFGHNLEKLFNAAISHEFNFQEVAMESLIKILNDAHSRGIYRYAEGSSVFDYIHERDNVEQILSACNEGMRHLR